MAWLRLDDGFTKHPKFEGWTPAQRWAWLEVMEYCARYRTGGRIPGDLSLLPRAVTRPLLERAKQSGWVDEDDAGTLWIHGWEDFNPGRTDDLTRAVESALAEHPDASANEVVRATGGNRKQVLELIRRFRGGSATGSGELVPPVVPELVTRARSRPVPSPSTTSKAAAATQDAADDAAAAHTIERLTALGLEPTATADLARAAAWLNLADTEATTNPAGYVLAGLNSGDWPSPRTPPSPDEPADERRRRFVTANGWRLPPDELEYQLDHMGANDDELVELLDTAADMREQRRVSDSHEKKGAAR